MRIEDVPLYAPCQPHWLCVPFMSVFTLLLLSWAWFFLSELSIANTKKFSGLKRCVGYAVFTTAIAKVTVARRIFNKPRIVLRVVLGIFALMLNYRHAFLAQPTV